MLLLKTRKQKLLLKKFIVLRKNAQNRPKILRFKKKKWQNLILFLQKDKTRSSYFDHNKFFLPTYYVVYLTNDFRENLHTKQRFNYFYGNLRVKYVKTIVNKIFKRNILFTNGAFLDVFESRLDVILYRCNFVPSIKNARQIIANKGVLVNKILITNSSFKVKLGDILEVNRIYLKPIYLHILLNTYIWSLTPNHLHINHDTLQIVIIGQPSKVNISKFFPFWFSIHTLIDYFK